VAITFGVLLALPQHDILITFIAFMLLGLLLIENDAWIVIFGPSGSLAYQLATKGSSWESVFILGVLAILAIKHFDELKSVPRLRRKLFRRFQAKHR